ncbi:MAG TPA: hypothetical protein VNJ02_10820 [Vicinamibacterales bacterium]|nr:hypothetical protein [Vicinamibacterales bacterium]
MAPRVLRLRDDERGMSLVLVCVGFTSFLAATTLAIDVGMFMNSRRATAPASAPASAAFPQRQWPGGAKRGQYR